MATPDTSKSLFPKTILFFFFFFTVIYRCWIGRGPCKDHSIWRVRFEFLWRFYVYPPRGRGLSFPLFLGISFLMTVASRLVIVESKWAWPKQQKRPRHGPWFGVSSAISMQSIHLDIRWEILYSWFINNETLHTSMSLSEAHEYYILWYLWHTYGTFQ